MQVWGYTNTGIARVVTVDSRNWAYTVGNQFITIIADNMTFINQFPISADVPKLALSLNEQIIYFQVDPFTVEARVITTGEFLWNKTFNTLIESIQVFPLGIVVDTLIQLDLLDANANVLGSFTATEGINSLLLYPDRVILNLDKTVAAYTYDGTFRQLYQLTGEFDYMCQAAGSSDLFFITSDTTLRAFSIQDGTEAWSFELQNPTSKIALGRNSIYLTSLSTFQHIALSSQQQEGDDPFPLWFLGWIIPLILLFVLFVFFAYRWNKNRRGYDVIQ